MDTYEEAAEKLGKRESRKLANHTYLQRRDEGTIALKLHHTDILTFTKDGVRYDTGGWHTPVTKDRMNTFGPVRLSQAGGIWYIFHNREIAHGLVYKDGMVWKDGKVKGAGKATEAERVVKERQRIKDFAKRYMDAFEAGKVPAPSGGDCWGCCMKSTTGEAVLEGGGADSQDHHIRGHIRENYYVPSLLSNALKAMGASQSMWWWVSGWWAETEAEKTRAEGWEERAKEERRELIEKVKGWRERSRVEKMLRRFVLQKLGHVR